MGGREDKAVKSIEKVLLFLYLAPDSMTLSTNQEIRMHPNKKKTPTPYEHWSSSEEGNWHMPFGNCGLRHSCQRTQELYAPLHWNWLQMAIQYGVKNMPV